ncbi:MAG: hypothetical protein WA461_05555 [Nitrososphaeraceae archaeon]
MDRFQNSRKSCVVSRDAAVIPPRHNAWVVGNEPLVGIDFTGVKEYAKS